MEKRILYTLLLSILLYACKSSKRLSKRETDLFSLDSVLIVTGKEESNNLFSRDFSELKPIKGVKKVSVDTLPKKAKILESEKKLLSSYKGVNRIKYYEFKHPDVPESFNGFKIAFISDLHYKSLFNQEGLLNLVYLLNNQKVDVLLMGGDYYEGCGNIPELFGELAKVRTTKGIYAILGNNDYETCYEQGVFEMQSQGIRILEHEVDTLWKGEEFILIAGIRNPFKLKENRISPTLSLHPDDFVILLTHTPDYAEDVSIKNTDLVLAGHTHGGQIRVLGYAPIIPSKYGQRFLTGLKQTTAGYPMIITNGIGTSQIDIRMFSPSEIVIITLVNPSL